MKFKSIEEFQNEVNKIPPDDAYVNEHGIIWLKQSYAINRMNEVFGEGNWNIEKIQKVRLEMKKKNSLEIHVFLQYHLNIRLREIFFKGKVFPG
jgi:hypothetical protein